MKKGKLIKIIVIAFAVGFFHLPKMSFANAETLAACMAASGSNPNIVGLCLAAEVAEGQSAATNQGQGTLNKWEDLQTRIDATCVIPLNIPFVKLDNTCMAEIGWCRDAYRGCLIQDQITFYNNGVKNTIDCSPESFGWGFGDEDSNKYLSCTGNVNPFDACNTWHYEKVIAQSCADPAYVMKNTDNSQSSAFVPPVIK